MIRRICMKLSLATDFLVRHIVRSVILIAVMTFCITTMISGVYLNISTNRYKSRIEALIDVPIENLSIVRDDEMSVETYRVFSETEGFIGAGTMDDMSGLYLSSWIGLSDAFQNNDDIKQVTVNFDFFQICKPELYDGKYYDIKEAERMFGEERIGIYIGANYRGAVPVGTTFKYKYSDQSEMVVLGHFKKGAKLLSSIIMEQENIDQNKTDIELDDKILFVDAGYPGCNYYFLASDIPADKFRAKVKDKLAPEVCIVTMEEALRYRDKKNESMYNLYNRLFVLIISVAVCMIFSFQIIAINESNKTYGVLLTNGYKQKDIAVIVTIENILKYLVAFSIALFMAYYKHYKVYKENWVGGDVKAFNKDFIIYTIPLCFLIGLGIVFLAIIVPLIRMCRRPVGEYLRDK